MRAISEELLMHEVSRFVFPGTFIRIEPYGNGHINDTFAVYFQEPDERLTRYIFQRVNGHVFKKPDEVMENVVGVTSYLKDRIKEAGGDPMRETLNLIPTVDGKYFDLDDAGDCWRAYVFIEGTTSYQLVSDSSVFYKSARAFGKFQMLLADYPAETLYDTIPLFHNTVDRMRQFREALEADKLGRAAGVQAEIDFVLEREPFTHILVDQLAAGKLPLRVTHNDTKLNNVLIDSQTGEGVCIIDLDTVMPGLSLYDFGDSIRFGAATAEEDETDLTKMHFDVNLFECYTKGFLEVAGGVMTPNELQNLPEGAKMMTLECGIRFLADYLAGDVYFKIHREQHNLDRARTQFRLVEEMEQNWELMHEIVRKYAKEPAHA